MKSPWLSDPIKSFEAWGFSPLLLLISNSLPKKHSLSQWMLHTLALVHLSVLHWSRSAFRSVFSKSWTDADAYFIGGSNSIAIHEWRSLFYFQCLYLKLTNEATSTPSWSTHLLNISVFMFLRVDFYAQFVERYHERGFELFAFSAVLNGLSPEWLVSYKVLRSLLSSQLPCCYFNFRVFWQVVRHHKHSWKFIEFQAELLRRMWKLDAGWGLKRLQHWSSLLQNPSALITAVRNLVCSCIDWLGER